MARKQSKKSKGKGKNKAKSKAKSKANAKDNVPDYVKAAANMNEQDDEIVVDSRDAGEQNPFADGATNDKKEEGWEDESSSEDSDEAEYENDP